MTFRELLNQYQLQLPHLQNKDLMTCPLWLLRGLNKMMLVKYAAWTKGRITTQCFYYDFHYP